MRALGFAGPLLLLLPFAGAQDLSQAAASGPDVFIKAGEGDWRPLDTRSENGRITLHVEPADTEGGRVLFLIAPPEGVAINDNTPPRITGLKVDGKPKPPSSDLWLGRGDWQPARIVVGAEDAENELVAGTIAFEVDGRRRPLNDPIVTRAGETFLIDLPNLDYGEHSVTFTASDNSPQANEVRLTVGWERIVPLDSALVGTGATLSVDSHFVNYPDLAPLKDGNTDLPGDHSLNDISWASEESEQPHWVEIDFGRPRRISRVILCWAYYGGHYHTAKRFEVQIPDGKGWRTIWSAPPEGLEPRKFTTATWDFAITRKVRIYQPTGGGPAHRPNIMWLAEVMAK